MQVNSAKDIQEKFVPTLSYRTLTKWVSLLKYLWARIHTGQQSCYFLQCNCTSLSLLPQLKLNNKMPDTVFTGADIYGQSTFGCPHELCNLSSRVTNTLWCICSAQIQAAGCIGQLEQLVYYKTMLLKWSMWTANTPCLPLNLLWQKKKTGSLSTKILLFAITQ